MLTLRQAAPAGLVALLAGVPALSNAAAVAISNAAYAATYVRDCRSTTNFSSTPDRCEVDGQFGQGPGGSAPTTLKEVRENMALGGTSAATSATLSLGSAVTPSGPMATQSSIDVSGAADTLLLKQGAFSGSSYARVSGHSLGLQSYQFTGTTGEVRSIENVLDFTANVTPNADLDLGGAGGSIFDPVVYAKTRVTVFSLDTASFDYDMDLGNFEVQTDGWHLQASGRSDYRLEASLEDLGITTSGRPTRLDFTMESGRYYFIESYLGLWARFGGWIDATHTFSNTLGRTDSSGAFIADNAGFSAADPLDNPVVTRTGFVTPPHSVVPVPGTLLNVALGLGVMALFRRRRPH